MHGREYTEDELWDNYGYFIKKVAPVAEAAGVYIGIHPDDPPFCAPPTLHPQRPALTWCAHDDAVCTDPLGGVPRALFGTFAGYQKAMQIAVSTAAPLGLLPNPQRCCTTGLAEHRRVPVPRLLA